MDKDDNTIGKHSLEVGFKLFYIKYSYKKGILKKTAEIEILKKQIPIVKRITEPKISYMILWEYFCLYKNVSLKMEKIYPKYYMACSGLCIVDQNCIH